MLLSVRDVAEKYGYSDSQIRRLIRAGTIKAQSLGAYYAIDEMDLAGLKKKSAPPKAKKRNKTK